jgi:glyoxylase-like metal-dependent hydrolase (beta-lactamase superfamily II)
VITTTDTLALHLNGDRLDVFHVADAHTSADLVVRWAQADVVALGDLYWNGQYPFIDRERGGSLAGLVAAVEAILARSTARTIIVPGHGPVSNRAELAAYRDMLVAVGRKVREAIEQGQLIDDILAAHPTAEFDARFAPPGAFVAPEDFVRNVYADLTRARSTR